MSSDLVATWDVALGDGKHKVEFEHGTISGKRVIRVDGKVNIVLYPKYSICKLNYVPMNLCTFLFISNSVYIIFQFTILITL